MKKESTNNKYRIKECLDFLTEIYDRNFTRQFKERVYSLLGISHSKFYRYMGAELGDNEKVETCSVSHMKMFVEQFNLVVPEENRVILDDMYHPELVYNELKLYRSPVVKFFPTAV
ncbi:hypothetical protein [uncultured Algoriphagus sp.]|uniref:hypothetical protein n=1 Tax=uncultured Algoriphagus sp. TaxID=417365 RepID=UPI00259495EA|nr:hypothetical protein [uncultured Algoriphagus sp.]